MNKLDYIYEEHRQVAENGEFLSRLCEKKGHFIGPNGGMLMAMHYRRENPITNEDSKNGMNFSNWDKRVVWEQVCWPYLRELSEEEAEEFMAKDKTSKTRPKKSDDE